MYHFEIVLGLILGVVFVATETGGGSVAVEGAAADCAAGTWLFRKDVLWSILCYFTRVVGTCAVFYVFFLCRMLGAGDIKLMAVCVGTLGVWPGCQVIFGGMVLALLAACVRGKVWKHGLLLMKNQEMRLAPYLFAGFCLYVSMQGGS